MGNPTIIRPFIKKVEATRKSRLKSSFPELTVEAKTTLLENYHPDFNQKVKRQLKVGVNKGDLASCELADLLEAPSKLELKRIRLDPVDYQIDVLVIGCGGGGLSAALTAKEAGADIMLATKLRMGDSNTIMAEGGISAATAPEDSPAIHYVDTLIGGRGINVPELVDVLVNDAPFIIEWLSSLGVNFDRLADGSYFTHRPGGHSRRRSHSVMDLTGLEVMRVLGDEVRNRGIQPLEFCPAVELLMDDKGQCAGAVLQNLDNDTPVVVQSKVTILATGGIYPTRSSMPHRGKSGQSAVVRKPANPRRAARPARPIGHHRNRSLSAAANWAMCV